MTKRKKQSKPAKKRAKPKKEIRPPVTGLTIADRFDLDDGYFDRPVEWDGGWHDEMDVW
jgi:hypothetical protein